MYRDNLRHGVQDLDSAAYNTFNWIHIHIHSDLSGTPRYQVVCVLWRDYCVLIVMGMSMPCENYGVDMTCLFWVSWECLRFVKIMAWRYNSECHDWMSVKIMQAWRCIECHESVYNHGITVRMFMLYGYLNVVDSCLQNLTWRNSCQNIGQPWSAAVTSSTQNAVQNWAGSYEAYLKQAFGPNTGVRTKKWGPV